MNHLTTALATLVTAADAGPVGAAPWWVLLIPAMPLVGVALCTACAIAGVRNMLPAFLSVGCLGVSCALAVMMYANLAGQTTIATAFPWFDLPSGSAPGHRFTADFGFYIDSLTCLWMLFVTGLAALIALYASEYMSHDLGTGYCRFFVAFNLFVFSMACLVMADNFILLYLGWEGVGLCSYLLIGYFYKKPSAVAAAKKAFIVNRIGDLGLALGIMLTFVQFGSVEYAKVLPEAKKFVDLAVEGHWDQIPFLVQVIPVLLMVGAMGKSAQFPLYVWLPDAMEGPTPVSALIHAATMVTAGVFLVARTYWLFLCSPWALPSLAWIGGITALLAATIGMAQFDIKRIMAYSTVSQLGYMFAGLGVLTSTGAAFHVLTHAFFKALLFLACGAVMHGFAGQLDLRKLSGLRKVKGWGIVSITMLIGCANLAGLPLITSGYFSKDMILAEAFVTPGYAALGVLLLATAGLTAYYTFRVYFRVFEGPVHHEPGDELHDHTDHAHDDHAHADHGHDAHAHGHGHDHGPAQGQAHEPAHGHKADVHDFHPHAPGWAINSVLAILAVLSCAAIGLYFIDGENHGWVGGLIHDSTAHFASPFAEHAPASGHAPEPGHGGQSHATASTGHASILGVADVHTEMYFISGLVGIVGVGVAFLLHLRGRTTAANAPSDAIAAKLGIIPRLATGKWYVDEIYDAIIRKPLLTLSHVFHLIDRLLVDGLVNLFGLLPRALAHAVRPMQNGVLHSYALGMAGGLALLLILVWLVTL